MLDGLLLILWVRNDKNFFEVHYFHNLRISIVFAFKTFTVRSQMIVRLKKIIISNNQKKFSTMAQSSKIIISIPEKLQKIFDNQMLVCNQNNKQLCN